MRQEFPERKRLAISGLIKADDRNLVGVLGEFGKDLAAHAARGPAVLGRHRDRANLPSALRNHPRDRAPFGAERETVGDVFDVRSRVDAALFVANRRPDAVAAVGGLGILPGLPGGSFQFGVDRIQGRKFSRRRLDGDAAYPLF